MSDLKIKDVKPKEAKNMNFKGYDISLKIDGTLIYWKDNKLYSPRCERTERFKHIAEILKAHKFPNCMGEMFVEGKGTNVFDVSKRENWNKAVFMPFDLLDNKKSFLERKEELNRLVEALNNSFITPTIQFKDFSEGWNYVNENESEGLVIRDNNNWIKVKLLKEIKLEIVEHETGKDKGTFILKNGSRISGTSQQLVIQYTGIKKRGKKPIGEIEYAFETKEGKLFQPRLRQITEE